MSEVQRSAPDSQGYWAADVDALIVGAGFAGLYMLHRLREFGLTARVIEAGSGVGGTWYWNRYPGARCDVESMEYSYQFSEALQQEWQWTERYAAQPEILSYANYVAERFELKRDIQLDTRVESADYDETTALWTLRTDRGEYLSAPFCVMATGCLSIPNTPDLPGREAFRGATYHTGYWPHAGVDFRGQRVGVIGTGSSAIQSIPILAEQAEHLYVFQRTPNFSVPAQNGPLDDATQQRIKTVYPSFRAENKQMGSGFGAWHPANDGSALDETAAAREQRYQHHWDLGGLLFMRAYSDLLLNADANDTAAEFVRNRIRATVADPEVAEKLCPRDVNDVVGCKRLCADTGYFETFNRNNVTLVDVREAPIEAITTTGLRTCDAHYDFDDLVFATGFDAMTGALNRIDIRGRGGRSLRKKWSEGPRTYLGLAVAGFPNLFTITGPGSPSVLTNMLPSIEQHVEWIADAIVHLRERGLATMEATPEAEDAWVEHVNAVADATLFPTCNSWYLGANVPGKPRVFMPCPGFPEYVAQCDEVVANGYEGFTMGAPSPGVASFGAARRPGPRDSA